jgi:parvulin-like peptidyl-prolyl isomerase
VEDLAKKQIEQTKREFTKHQLSRWQQQKRRQRIIFGSAILIILAVLGVIGAGIYIKEYLPNKPLHETVIEVNDTKFDMEYLIKTIELYCSIQGLSTEYAQYMFDGVVQAIEQSELARQEAAKLGITVSDEEVDEALNSYDPPLSEDYRDIIRTQLLTEKLNDDYFDQQVPTYAKQRHIWAMFLETEKQANEVRARLGVGEDFAELAGELSLDTTSKASQGDLGWHPEGVLTLTLGISLVDEYAFGAEVGALSSPILDETKTKMVGYWLIEVLSRDMEAKTASVKVMLLGSEQEANEVRARLGAGEDFATLAKELSQHSASKDNGGAFEVTAEGTVSSAFDGFVFDPEVKLNTLSQPIRDDTMSTKGGYWLVKVTEIDSNRQISDDDRTSLKADALNKWVNSLSDNPENKVVSYLDDEKKRWAISYIFVGLGQ